MITKHAQRYIVFILLTALILSVIPVKAADTEPIDVPEIPEEFVSISTIQCGITMESGGKAHCFSAVTTYNATHVISLTMYLQRSSDKSSWSSIYSWSTSGTGHASLDKYRYVTSGYWYRCVANVTVCTSSGAFVEYAYMYSNVVKA